WESAYSNLNDALEAAEKGDQIWVAQGIYVPSESDREVSFQMKDGVDLYGGFSGVETELDQRDWENNTTTLSGEIGDRNSTSDNIMTILMAANGVLDGFTISGANGSTSDNNSSGAQATGHLTPESVLSRAGQPGLGAGIQIWQVSPEIRNCTVTNNSSGKAGGIYIIGKGMLEEGEKSPATPTFYNCVISHNAATERGGGVSIDMSGSAWFIDTVFEGNSCTNGKGGAIYDDFGCSPYVINCLFIDNFAQSGAAMGNDGMSNPVIFNTTFYHNEASASGAALYQGTGPYNDPTVINSVIWGNICEEDEASIFNWNDCYTTVINSVVEGGYPGTDIISEIESLDSVDLGYSSERAESRSYDDVASLKEEVSLMGAGYDPVILDRDNPAALDNSLISNTVLYVSEEGRGNGASWAEASGSLQDMINQAELISEKSGKTVQVWISEGTYYTGSERSDSIYLRDGVEVFGGFSGSEASLDQRISNKFRTVISGDLGEQGVAADNSYHVFIGADDVVLDSLYITGGYADGQDGEVYDNKGGAVLNYWGGKRARPDLEPTLGFDITFNNCVFADNYALEGGAVYTYHGGNPVFTSCEFINNRADYGGATVDRAGVNSLYIDCEFNNNSVDYKGGALFVDYGSMATIKSSVFEGNSAMTSGGAVYVIDRASQAIPNETDINLIDPTWTNSKDIFSSILVEGSRFTANSAGLYGGAFYIYESSTLKVSGSDFEDNEAGRSGDAISLVNKSILYKGEGNPLLDSEIYHDENSSIK
ncbi:MAG: right-handed parallel beta-helix repeat-containing protein, partial [Spirochaetales bacterium]|nr:right-handed parallel beta-helix repeat-containing protein [Spirochaetales bacterium]